MVFSDLLPFRSEVVINRETGEPFVLTESQKAGGILAKRSNQGSFEKTQTLTIRINGQMMRFLNVAAARSAETSRNEIINQLLRAGMNAAWERMSEEEQKDFLHDLVNLET